MMHHTAFIVVTIKVIYINKDEGRCIQQIKNSPLFTTAFFRQ